jgi:hypothetical protein
MEINRESKHAIESDAGRITDLMWAANKLLEGGGEQSEDHFERVDAVWAITETAADLARRIAERLDKVRDE